MSINTYFIIKNIIKNLRRVSFQFWTQSTPAIH